MATRTAAQNGLWSDTATWGGTVPVNGDAFNIPAGIVVKCDVDQSGMATGMAASVLDGLLHFDADTNTCLKMNGNITGTGALYICERATVTGFTLTTDKTNTYQVARSLDVATVEDTLGAGYLDAVEELIETAIDVENAARVAQGLNEMMPDAVQDFKESTKAALTLSQILTYVESTPASFYHDTVNDILYIHTSDSTDPSGKTITVIEPINRPASGSEYRGLVLFNTSGQFGLGQSSIIRFYGEYVDREWTQLSGNAALNDTVLPPLLHDLKLQVGEKISIGSGTEQGYPAETSKGTYTVQSYDAETKIITLTSGLQTARLSGDYVTRLSQSITLKRTSGTTAYTATVIDGGIVEGVKIENGGKFITVPTGSPSVEFSSNWKFNHVVAPNGGRTLLWYATDCEISNSILQYNNGDTIAAYVENLKIKGCVSIGTALAAASKNVEIIRSIVQNGTYIGGGGVIKSCIAKNNTYCASYNANNHVISNCEFEDINLSQTTSPQFVPSASFVKFVNCSFKGNSAILAEIEKSELHNCIIEDTVILVLSDSKGNIIVSFDHNQQPGNYKAWMRGGRIETALDGTTPLPGRLILSCESADYPVFRDYPVLLPAYRTSTWQALTRKSFTGGSVKIELIDPANDPLIDTSAQPLATYSLPDQADTNLPLKLGYKSDKAMQAIIRVSAQNATGTVEVDTRLIENRIQHGQ